MARRTATKRIRQARPTLIGAGITEQYYFTHLQTIFGLKVKIRPRYFGREGIHALEKKIQQVLDDDGKAIVVFDADVSTWDIKERQRLTSLKKKYIKEKNVIICDSLPSIEYWFLLHYINTTRNFRTSQAVISQLSKYVVNFDKTESFLKNQKWVSDLCSEGKLQIAYKTAKNNSNKKGSYSNVWKAIEEIGLLKKIGDK
jgi:hypothetical protein